MSIVLLVKIGGETHPLTISRQPIILGRSKRCNVRFSDNMMSSRHCEIKLGDNYRIIVKDLNSSNGTYINDSKIEAGHIFVGDTLTIGNITLAIDIGKLTKLEREALTDDNIKKRKRFVDLKDKKSSGKTQLIQDFTQINMVIPKEFNRGNANQTCVINQADLNPPRKAVAKAVSKRKSKIVNKDKTGFFKKILKGFKKTDD